MVTLAAGAAAFLLTLYWPANGPQSGDAGSPPIVSENQPRSLSDRVEVTVVTVEKRDDSGLVARVSVRNGNAETLSLALISCECVTSHARWGEGTFMVRNLAARQLTFEDVSCLGFIPSDAWMVCKAEKAVPG
jgi:hypothetical protein